MTHVICSECKWGGPLEDSRTVGSCPNCGARYDFDVPPPSPRTHVMLPAHATSACGLDYITVAHHKQYHASTPSKPTCEACRNYEELRDLNDDLRKKYITLAERILTAEHPLMCTAATFDMIQEAVLSALTDDLK